MPTRAAIKRMLIGSFAGLVVSGCMSVPRMPGASPNQVSATGQAQPATTSISGQLDQQQQKMLVLADSASPGGGWVIAASPENIARHRQDAARRANQQAERQPATAANARNSDTADLNHDGFVTLDEVLAMKHAGLSDSELITRLAATGQVFALTDRQQQYLRDRGINQNVIDAMLSLRGGGADSSRAASAGEPARTVAGSRGG